MADHDQQHDQGESVLRRLVNINGENYYLTVGMTKVHATVPYENRKERELERLVIDTLCDNISDCLEMLKAADDNKKQQPSNKPKVSQ